MQNEPKSSGTSTTDEPARSGISQVFAGAVGLTKAALRVDRADEVLIRRRRSLCGACPQANAGASKTSRCLVCTCFIHPKTATASEKCPLGKW
jgi:hypothetical protein